MADVSSVLPFAVNFLVVVLLLVVLLRKPLRRLVYQRHQHLTDFVEASAQELARATERARRAAELLAGAEREAAEILERERGLYAAEAKEVELLGSKEAERLGKEAAALAAAIGAESDERVRSIFVDEIIAKTKAQLKTGLRKDDHSAIIRRAESNIGAGL